MLGTVDVRREDGFLIELHPREVVAVPPPLGRSFEDGERRRALLGELRFTELAKTEQSAASDQAKAWLEAQGLKPLTPQELSLIERYLPTGYWRNPPKPKDEWGRELLTFELYNFHEGVPTHVLERMALVKDLFVHEIRTPEAMMSDPAWLGHVFDKTGRLVATYLLARWGRDSDANFLPSIADIRHILKARYYGDKVIEPMTIVMTIACILSGVLAAATIHGGFIALGIIAAVGSVIGGVSLQRWSNIFLGRRWLQKNHPHLVPLL